MRSSVKCLLFAFASNTNKQCQNWEQWQWFALVCLGFVKDFCQKLAHIDDSGSSFKSIRRHLCKQFSVTKIKLKAFLKKNVRISRCGSTLAVAIVIYICLYFIKCKFWILNVKKIPTVLKEPWSFKSVFCRLHFWQFATWTSCQIALI